MAISKARHKANERYNAKAYDEIKVRVGKGQKEVIQSKAAERGESLNEYIKKAIAERMERQAAGEDAQGGVVMGFSAPVREENSGSRFTTLPPEQ